MALQLSRELINELYKEAQTNGFNNEEYLLLITGVDNLLTNMSVHTQEYTKGIKPNDYDVNGKEIKG